MKSAYYLANEGLPTVLLYWGPSTWLSQLPDIFDRSPDGKPHALAIGPDELEREIQADLDDAQPVRALARWRCSLNYRQDAELPSPARRVELARSAAALARRAEEAGEHERAVRNYSACAVIGLSSFSPSVSCRMAAERLRGALFPRRKKR